MISLYNPTFALTGLVGEEIVKGLHTRYGVYQLYNKDSKNIIYIDA